MTTSDDDNAAAGPAEDAAQLARRFLDLWQDQVSSVAADPQTAELMSGWLRAQATMAEAAMGAGQAMMEAASRDSATGSTGQSPERPEATAAASRRGDDDVAELARRVVDCEKRIAALERQLAGPGKRSSAGSRSRKP